MVATRPSAKQWLELVEQMSLLEAGDLHFAPMFFFWFVFVFFLLPRQFRSRPFFFFFLGRGGNLFLLLLGGGLFILFGGGPFVVFTWRAGRLFFLKAAYH